MKWTCLSLVWNLDACGCVSQVGLSIRWRMYYAIINRRYRFPYQALHKILICFLLMLLIMKSTAVQKCAGYHSELAIEFFEEARLKIISLWQEDNGRTSVGKFPLYICIGHKESMPLILLASIELDGIALLIHLQRKISYTK